MCCSASGSESTAWAGAARPAPAAQREPRAVAGLWEPRPSPVCYGLLCGAFHIRRKRLEFVGFR